MWGQNVSRDMTSPQIRCQILVLRCFVCLSVVLVPIPFQLLLAVSSCERPVTPSSTFSMLPSVTSFIRASDSQVSKEILARAQQKATAAEETKEEKMETDNGAAGSKKEGESSRCLFEIEDSGVCEQLANYWFAV